MAVALAWEPCQQFSLIIRLQVLLKAMGGTARCYRLSTVSIAAAMLMLCLPDAATQTPSSGGEVAEGAVTHPQCPMTAASVGQIAQRICGGTPIDEALLAVRLRPGEVAGMSVGDRSKVRLLVEDTAHLDRLVGSDVQTRGQVVYHNSVDGLPHDVRRLKADPAENDRGPCPALHRGALASAIWRRRAGRFATP